MLLLLASLLFAPLASAEKATVPAHAVVKVAFNKKLKKSILVDSRGFTLYMYTADLPGSSACVNDATYHCSKAWPPLLTKGAPKAAASARASLLGTIRRPDGTTQVTYNNHPLYTFVGDAGRRGATSGGGAPARPTGEPAGPARGPEWIPGRATRDPMRYLP